jgi:hypothetical protein
LTLVDSSSLADTDSTAFIVLAPCDLVMADIQAQTADERAIALLETCCALEAGPFRRWTRTARSTSCE